MLKTAVLGLCVLLPAAASSSEPVLADPLAGAVPLARELVRKARTTGARVRLKASPRLPSGSPPLGKTINKYFGAHAPLFVVEKSYNRQNILIVYTTMDSRCRIVRDARGYELGFYWLDDGTSFHFSRVESQIRQKISYQRAQVNGKDDPYSIIINLTELDRVKHDLPDKRMVVRSESINGACEARAFLTLGGNPPKKTRVTWTYTDLTPSMFDATIHSITVRGHDAADDGSPVERTYRGTPR